MNLRNNLTLTLFSLFAGLLIWVQPTTVQAQCSAPYFIDQRFPTNNALPEETRWRFCWQRVTKNGLVINAAFFRKSPTSPWVQVIYDARVIELFVPYHSGSPRFLDMSSFNFSLFPLTSKHCPQSAGGTLLDNNYVCKQVRDRGLAWTNYGSVLHRPVPADHDGEMLLFHLEAPGRRPTARSAGGRVGTHPPPHPDRRQCAGGELRRGRILIHPRRGERVRVVNLDRVTRGATDVRPVEGDARAGTEPRVRSGADERRRWQRVGGRRRSRGRGRDSQRRRAAYAGIGRGDADTRVGSHGRCGNGEGHARGVRRHGHACRHGGD